MTDIPSYFTGPGLVDLQMNGYSGFDFNSDPDRWTAGDFYQIAEALNRRGIIAALLTFITDDTEAMMTRAS